jgi:hypothetical protein
MSSPVTAPLIPIVNAVVERAVTAGNDTALVPVTNTSGVTEYAAPNVMVQEVAAVPVVTSPVASFEPAVSAGEPVPQEDTVGVAGVDDAKRCPYWSTWKRVPGVLVPRSCRMGLLVFGVLVFTVTMLEFVLLFTVNAAGEVVAIQSAELNVEEEELVIMFPVGSISNSTIELFAFATAKPGSVVSFAIAKSAHGVVVAYPMLPLLLSELIIKLGVELDVPHAAKAGNVADCAIASCAKVGVEEEIPTDVPLKTNVLPVVMWVVSGA